MKKEAAHEGILNALKGMNKEGGELEEALESVPKEKKEEAKEEAKEEIKEVKEEKKEAEEAIGAGIGDPSIGSEFKWPSD